MNNIWQFTDDQLLELARAGDRQAEEQLAVTYSRLVRSCARPYFLAGGDSEDLTQEGMLGLLSAIREYDPHMGAAFRTYAEVCINRRLLSAVKAASRKKHTPLNEGMSLEQILSDETQTHPSQFASAFRRGPEEQVLARERTIELLSAYSRCLSKLEIQVLNLYLDGLSYQEMAERLGRPPKSIDNAVQRIRKKLAQFHPGESSES